MLYFYYCSGNYKFEKILCSQNLKTTDINGVNMSDLIPLHTDQTIDAVLEFGLVKTENDIKVHNLINGLNFEYEYENTVMTNKDQELNSHLIFLSPIIIEENLKTFGLVNGKDLTRLVTTDTDQNLTASYLFNGKITVDTSLRTSGMLNNINITDWSRRTVTAIGENTQDINDKWTVVNNISFLSDVIGNGQLGSLHVKQINNMAANKQREKFRIENIIRNDYKKICTVVQNLVKVSKQRPFVFKHLEFHEKLNFEHNISAVHYFQHNQRYYLIISQKHNCHSSLYEWIPNNFKFISNLKTGEVDQFITVLDGNRVYLVTKDSKTSFCENLGVNVWIFNDDTLTHLHSLGHSVSLETSKLPGTFYSMSNKSIIEYKLFYKDENTVVHAYKQWENDNDKMERFNNQQDVESDYEQTIGKFYGEYINMKIGNFENVLKLRAVAVWEEATINGLSDEIRILDDSNNGKLYDKIATLRPSNLNVMQFDRTGETFLMFLEDYKILKLYEFDYRGRQGFKQRSETNVAATKMISLTLPVLPFHSRRTFLLLVHKNTLTIIQAMMYGDRTIDSFQCEPEHNLF